MRAAVAQLSSPPPAAPRQGQRARASHAHARTPDRPDPALPRCGRRPILLLLAVLLATALRPTPAAAQFTNSLRRDFWDTDGTVHALIATKGRIYLGGSFTYVAPKGRKAAAFDSATARTVPGFPAVYGAAIHVILADAQGGCYLGGEFTEIAGLPRTNLVHLLADYSVDPDFQPDPNGPVYALALNQDTLYVGGEFDHLADQPRDNLAAINLATQQTTAWHPGTDGRVSALLVAQDRVYAGGSFKQIGGVTRRCIAALDALTGTTLPWNPDPDGTVLTLGWADHRLFVGGTFNRIGGRERNGLASLDPVTGAATAWNPAPEPVGAKVTVLRLQCTTVFVAGYFTNLGGWPRHQVGAVDMNTGVATGWNPLLNPWIASNQPSTIRDLAVHGDTVYLAGEFREIGGQPQRDLAAVSSITGDLLPWQPAADGGVSALAPVGRNIVAGFLHAPGGVERLNLAAFDALTGEVTDWNPGANDTVYALAAAGNVVYAGGQFTEASGAPRNRLAAINATTGALLQNWHPQANDTVRTLALLNSNLYVGGSFTELDGYSRGRLAALDAATGQLRTDWQPFADGTVYALAPAANRLYVGGAFSTLAGQRQHRLSALDAASGDVISPWPAGADAPVLALAVSVDTLYVGGQFTTVDGQPRTRLAAIDLLTNTLTEWKPAADADVRALAASDDTIFVGGTFWQVNGIPRFGCAALDTAGALLAWNPGSAPGNRINALADSESLLYVGGELPLRFAASPSRHAFAAFPQTGAPVLEQPPSDLNMPADLSATFQVVATGEPPLAYQWQFQGANLPGATNATLLLDQVQPDHTGAYRVLVSNARGAATATAYLTVLEPVHIISEPQPQSVMPGVTFTLSVTATGSPPPQYQWRLNGVNIPGAVHPTLLLSNVQPASGGQYQVVAANRLGAVASQPATVTVAAPTLAFADTMADRATLIGSFGTGMGSNHLATAEPGEPNHAGKRGGKSVWLTWTAPANGIASFSTRGSTFDTLLAVYTNNPAINSTPSFPSLVPVAADEDRGGFLTSAASWNAEAGAAYVLAIDGFAGAAGTIVLHWSLDTNDVPFPRILSQPASQTIPRGGPAIFEVTVASDTPVSFQWFRGCLLLQQETNASLLIPSAQYPDVGSYRVLISNASAQPAESQPAILEIGPDPQVRSHDKLEDLWPAPALPAQTLPLGYARLAAASLPPGFILVGVGSIDAHTLNNAGGTTSPNEPLHCDHLGGASQWLGLHPTNTGVLIVDTLGSEIDTLIAVYNSLLQPIDCDTDSAPDGRSWLRLPVQQAEHYLVVVDGLNGARGTIQFHWQMGLPPAPVPASFPTPLVRERDALELAISTSPNTAPCTYRWCHNGNLLPDATAPVLRLPRVRAEHGGEYHVTVENAFGATNLLVALVSVQIGYLRPELQSPEPEAVIRLWLPELPPDDLLLLLQSSTNATDWTPLDLYPGSNPLPYRDYPATNRSRQFFRAIPLDSPP